MCRKCTKERLLESAAEVFAHKGFAQATINEICESAGANIAAINYHFGDKENFYDHVWRYALRISEEICPIFLPEDEEHSAEDRLRFFIRNSLRQIFGEGSESLFPRLLSREMADPTRAIDCIIGEVFAERTRRIMAIFRELLGDGAEDSTLFLFQYSLISQIVFPNMKRAVRERVELIHKGACEPPAKMNPAHRFFLYQLKGEERVRVLTEHIYRMIMAGVNDYRAEVT